MKKQTRLELEQERDRLREQNTLLSHALTILAQKTQPNVTSRVALIPLLNEFGLEGIKPHSCTIREAFK